MKEEALTDREPKHLMIHNQIEKYGQILDRFSGFLAEIKGEPMPKAKAEKESANPLPSLLDVLTNGSDRLSILNQRLEDLCVELKSLLF